MKKGRSNEEKALKMEKKFAPPAANLFVGKKMNLKRGGGMGMGMGISVGLMHVCLHNIYP